jgi:hypothetical protein
VLNYLKTKYNYSTPPVTPSMTPTRTPAATPTLTPTTTTTLTLTPSPSASSPVTYQFSIFSNSCVFETNVGISTNQTLNNVANSWYCNSDFPGKRLSLNGTGGLFAYTSNNFSNNTITPACSGITC